MVIINETAVTQHHMWLLPSPARQARLPSPWTGRGIGKERAKESATCTHLNGVSDLKRNGSREGIKKFTDSKNDSLPV